MCWRIFIALIAAPISIAYCQPPTIQWEHSLGGTLNEYAYSCIQSTDGNYVIVGMSESNDGDVANNNGGEDFWLIKLDSVGNIIWEYNYGGSNDDRAHSVYQCADGGYVIAGSTLSNDGDVSGNHGDYDFWVIKVNSMGILQWQNCLGGSSEERAEAVVEDSLGNIQVVGYTSSQDGDAFPGTLGLMDFWTVTLDSLGNLITQGAFGGFDDDRGSSFTTTSDGKHLVAGYVNSNDGFVWGNHGLNDAWVFKTDMWGSFEWQVSYGGMDQDRAESITTLSNGETAVAGWSFSSDGDLANNHGGKDYWVMRIDSIGGIIWSKTLGGSLEDHAMHLVPTGDNGVLIVGASESNDIDVIGNHGQNDHWIVKLNSLGIMEWGTAFGGTGQDKAFEGITTNDGGYLLCGYSNVPDGDVTSNNGGADMWVIKLTPDTGVVMMPPSPAFGTPNTYVCVNNCMEYTDQSFGPPATTWNWTFEGGTPATSTAQNPDTICYDSLGTYDVTLVVSNAYGSDTLTVQNYMNAVTIDTSITVSNGTLMLNFPSGQFQWINCINGNPITWATNSWFTPLQNGTYAVVITSWGGCSDTSSCYTMTGVGLNEKTSVGKLNIHPNPTTGIVIVDGQWNTDNGIEVLDMFGRSVHYSTTPSIPSLDLGHLPNGVYFIKAGEQTVKVVVSH